MRHHGGEHNGAANQRCALRRLGDEHVVGAGATVLKDLPPHVVAYGTPARAVRERKSGEKYL